MLMVRIGHSSRPGRGRTPRMLLCDARFRAAVGLGDNPAPALATTPDAPPPPR